MVKIYALMLADSKHVLNRAYFTRTQAEDIMNTLNAKFKNDNLDIQIDVYEMEVE